MAVKPRTLFYLLNFVLLCLCFALLLGCSEANPSPQATATPSVLGLAYRTISPNYYTTATALPAPSPTSTPLSIIVPTLPPIPTFPPTPTQSNEQIRLFRVPYSMADDITNGEPTATAIDAWLKRFNSPQIKEAPNGQTMGEVYVRLGRRWGINPAYALAFFTKESSCGTAGSNLASYNFGNIRWSPGYPTKDGVWRAYASWTEGMEAWFKLISTEYLAGGLRTVDQILPVYAPPTENDTSLYIEQVKQWVKSIMTY